MSYGSLIRLRYPAACRLCGTAIEAGATGYWDRADRGATCVPCAASSPADPFAGVDPELTGIAGASAQAEFERRRARYGQTKANKSWEKGAEGERHLSGRLHAKAGLGRVEILDDVRVPGSRANIDHIAIAPSGIYVIDAKNYTGRVTRKVEGFGRRRRTRLMVGSRDQTRLVAAMEWQIDAVRKALVDVGETRLPTLVPVLCFVGSDNWGLFDGPISIDGVQILWPRALIKLLQSDGPLEGRTRTRLARLISTQLRPAA
jgi:hypothetical protein